LQDEPCCTGETPDGRTEIWEKAIYKSGNASASAGLKARDAGPDWTEAGFKLSSETRTI
jgi:hypothetical protein